MPPSEENGQAPQPAQWTVYCDGSAVPNPGRMGLGAVIRGPDGVLHTISAKAESHGCNNEAELRAVIAALRELQQHDARDVLIHSDNSIVVEQLASQDAMPIARLAPLFEEARLLVQSFASARLVWVPRHRNREADVLARAALGLAPKVPAQKSRQSRN